MPSQIARSCWQRIAKVKAGDRKTASGVLGEGV
jgi:hypothetical protein